MWVWAQARGLGYDLVLFLSLCLYDSRNWSLRGSVNGNSSGTEKGRAEIGEVELGELR